MARTYHQKIVDRALESIRKVHADDSVELEQIFETLNLLEGLVLDCIDEVREAIQRRETK